MTQEKIQLTIKRAVFKRCKPYDHSINQDDICEYCGASESDLYDESDESESEE